MSILDRIFRPQNSIAGSNYLWLPSRSVSGKYINAKSAMTNTAVYACVRVISEALASAPLHTYHIIEDGSSEKATGTKLYSLLHDAPNPEMTAFTFIEMMAEHILLWGNAYAQIIRNGKGEVIALYPLMADRMNVKRDQMTKEIVYEYTVYEDEAKLDTGSTVILTKHDVLHIPGLGFSGLVGFSPITMASNAIGLGLSAEEYASVLMSNQATPGGVLEHPGHLENPDRIREQWKAKFGNENAGSVAVLEEGMKYHPISINPVDAQFLEQRRYQINEIARIFKVPPHMIGDLEKSSFSNIEQQSLEFTMYTVDPWCIRFEQAFKQALLNEKERQEYFFKFNTDGLLRGDYQSRMQGYAVGIQNGFMCPNDVRRLENMNLIPEEEGGNNYMANGNMLKLKDIGAYANGVGGKESNEQ